MNECVELAPARWYYPSSAARYSTVYSTVHLCDASSGFQVTTGYATYDILYKTSITFTNHYFVRPVQLEHIPTTQTVKDWVISNTAISIDSEGATSTASGHSAYIAGSSNAFVLHLDSRYRSSVVAVSWATNYAELPTLGRLVAVNMPADLTVDMMTTVPAAALGTTTSSGALPPQVRLSLRDTEYIIPLTKPKSLTGLTFATAVPMATAIPHQGHRVSMDEAVLGPLVAAGKLERYSQGVASVPTNVICMNSTAPGVSPAVGNSFVVPISMCRTPDVIDRRGTHNLYLASRYTGAGSDIHSLVAVSEVSSGCTLVQCYSIWTTEWYQSEFNLYVTGIFDTRSARLSISWPFFDISGDCRTGRMRLSPHIVAVSSANMCTSIEEVSLYPECYLESDGVMLDAVVEPCDDGFCDLIHAGGGNYFSFSQYRDPCWNISAVSPAVIPLPGKDPYKQIYTIASPFSAVNATLKLPQYKIIGAVDHPNPILYSQYGNHYSMAVNPYNYPAADEELIAVAGNNNPPITSYALACRAYDAEGSEIYYGIPIASRQAKAGISILTAVHTTVRNTSVTCKDRGRYSSSKLTWSQYSYSPYASRSGSRIGHEALEAYRQQNVWYAATSSPIYQDSDKQREVGESTPAQVFYEYTTFYGSGSGAYSNITDATGAKSSTFCNYLVLDNSASAKVTTVSVGCKSSPSASLLWYPVPEHAVNNAYVLMDSQVHPITTPCVVVYAAVLGSIAATINPTTTALYVSSCSTHYYNSVHNTVQSKSVLNRTGEYYAGSIAPTLLDLMTTAVPGDVITVTTNVNISYPAYCTVNISNYIDFSSVIAGHTLYTVTNNDTIVSVDTVSYYSHSSRHTAGFSYSAQSIGTDSRMRVAIAYSVYSTGKQGYSSRSEYASCVYDPHGPNLTVTWSIWTPEYKNSSKYTTAAPPKDYAKVATDLFSSYYELFESHRCKDVYSFNSTYNYTQEYRYVSGTYTHISNWHETTVLNCTLYPITQGTVVYQTHSTNIHAVISIPKVPL